MLDGVVILCLVALVVKYLTILAVVLDGLAPAVSAKLVMIVLTSKSCGEMEDLYFDALCSILIF